MRRLYLFIFAALLLASCGQSVAPASNSAAPAVANTGQPLKVATTVGMITDIVRVVGGERVQVTGLMGPGVDPHLYKPSAGDVRALESADVIFYGGLELEGRMTDVFVKLASSGKPTFAVTADMPRDRLREPKEFEGKYDPHVWFDVQLWQFAVRTVAARLSEIDPGSKAGYESRRDAYLQELDTLHQYAKTEIASIPERQRVLVTAHDAFGYFGAQYGIEVRGLQGTSTAAEAGAGDVQQLAQFLCERQVKAIFVESSVPRATVEAVQAGAKARGCNVALGGELFSDALGADGTPEGTYVGMIRHNVDTIVKALR